MPKLSEAELKAAVEQESKRLAQLQEAIPDAVKAYREAYDRAVIADEKAKAMRSEVAALEASRSELIRVSVGEGQLGKHETTIVAAKQRAQTLRDAAAAQDEITESCWAEANRLHEALKLADKRIEQAHRTARRALYDLEHARFVLGTIAAMERFLRVLPPDVFPLLPDMQDVVVHARDRMKRGSASGDDKAQGFPGEDFGIPADAPTSGVR
jgi:chromosome segregation ATPase